MGLGDFLVVFMIGAVSGGSMLMMVMMSVFGFAVISQ